jgi:hypothetical protein
MHRTWQAEEGETVSIDDDEEEDDGDADKLSRKRENEALYYTHTHGLPPFGKNGIPVSTGCLLTAVVIVLMAFLFGA